MNHVVCNYCTYKPILILVVKYAKNKASSRSLYEVDYYTKAKVRQIVMSS